MFDSVENACPEAEFFSAHRSGSDRAQGAVGLEKVSDPS
jgi:hypothetical protein